MKLILLCTLLFSRNLFAERKPAVTVSGCATVEDCFRDFIHKLPRNKLKLLPLETRVRGRMVVELDLPPSNRMRELKARIEALPAAPFEYEGRRYDFAQARMRVDRKALPRAALREDLFPEPYGQFMAGAAVRDEDTGVLHVDHVLMRSPDVNFKLSLQFLAAVLRGSLQVGNETFDLSFLNFDAHWTGDYDLLKHRVFDETLIKVTGAMLERSAGLPSTLTCEEIMAGLDEVNSPPLAR